jgi:acyl carrier protein
MERTVERAEVLQKVRSIVNSELGDRSLHLTEDTAIANLPDWDSVAHFRIVIALEIAFGIFFELEEQTEFEKIGQVVDCICHKLARQKSIPAGR